jgi:hypothetical protein
LGSGGLAGHGGSPISIVNRRAPRQFPPLFVGRLNRTNPGANAGDEDEKGVVFSDTLGGTRCRGSTTSETPSLLPTLSAAHGMARSRNDVSKTWPRGRQVLAVFRIILRQEPSARRRLSD